MLLFYVFDIHLPNFGTCYPTTVDIQYFNTVSWATGGHPAFIKVSVGTLVVVI